MQQSRFIDGKLHLTDNKHFFFMIIMQRLLLAVLQEEASGPTDSLSAISQLLEHRTFSVIYYTFRPFLVN
jgi:hypothetical protein